MTASVKATPTPEELVNKWLESLEADDHARGTICRYRSAVLSFVSWYEQQEYRPLALERFSPITLVGYRNFFQRTQTWATSTVNGHLSTLRTWYAWLTEQRYLEEKPEFIVSFLLNNSLLEWNIWLKTLI